MDSSSILKIVMMGTTGAGKSRLANKIGGQDDFKVGKTLFSETTNPEERRFSQTRIGRDLTILDTQGFLDNRKTSLETTLLAPIKLFNQLKSGFNMILCCEPARDRFDKANILNLKKLGILLGKDVFNHILIVITHLDRFRNCPEDRERIISNYTNQLPVLLKENNIPIPQNNILFADYQHFEDFEEALKIQVEKFDFFKIQTQIENLDHSFESLRHPIFQDYLRCLEKDYQMELEESGEDTEEREQLESLRLIVQILQGSFPLKTELICKDLLKLKSKRLQKLGQYFLSNDVNEPLTLINDLYEEFSTYFTAESKLERRIHNSLFSILGQNKEDQNFATKFNDVFLKYKQARKESLVQISQTVGLAGVSGGGSGLLLTSLGLSIPILFPALLGLMVFLFQSYKGSKSSHEKCSKELYEKIIESEEINELLMRSLFAFFSKLQ